jgi:hypothetical protein
MMMQQAGIESKAVIQEKVDALINMVEAGVRSGAAAHTLERSLFEHVLQLGHVLLGLYFELQGNGDLGATLPRADGREVRRLDEPRTRCYLSVFGEHELTRYVYGSREGQRIEYIPLDDRLQLPEAKFSYLVQDWAQSLAVEMSYSQVRQILSNMLNLDIGVSSLERMTNDFAGDAEIYWDQSPAVPSAKGTFIVATADGKGVPIRKGSSNAPIVDHDPGKKPPVDRKKMALLGSVYDSEPNIRTPDLVVETLFGEPLRKNEAMAANDPIFAQRPKPLAKAIRACLTHTDDDGNEINARTTIFEWLAEQVAQRDPSSEKPVVVIMDGQISLWNDAEKMFGDRPRVEVLDLLHATSKLWDAVHICYPKDRELEVMKLFTYMILEGKIEEVIIWFRHAAETGPFTKKECEKLTSICGYFERHQSRMRYDEYLAQGYPIASGVIEGACRHVVKDRLERTGMRWTIQGARNMLNLRCMSINDKWKDYTQLHIDQENKRLYSGAQPVDRDSWPCALAA